MPQCQTTGRATHWRPRVTLRWEVLSPEVASGEAMFACKAPLTAARGSRADVHTSVNLQQKAGTAGDATELQPVSVASSSSFIEGLSSEES